MSDWTTNKPRRLAAIAGMVGALCVMGLMTWLMVKYTQPPPLTAQRAAERAKALAEMNAQNREALTTYGYVDPARDVVRLPIARAMELAVQNFKNPSAGRSNLISRVERATARLPEKPNIFE